MSLLKGADTSPAKPYPEHVPGLANACGAASAAQPERRQLTKVPNKPPARAQPQSRRVIRKLLPLLTSLSSRAGRLTRLAGASPSVTATSRPELKVGRRNRWDRDSCGSSSFTAVTKRPRKQKPARLLSRADKRHRLFSLRSRPATASGFKPPTPLPNLLQLLPRWLGRSKQLGGQGRAGRPVSWAGRPVF